MADVPALHLLHLQTEVHLLLLAHQSGAKRREEGILQVVIHYLHNSLLCRRKGSLNLLEKQEAQGGDRVGGALAANLDVLAAHVSRSPLTDHLKQSQFHLGRVLGHFQEFQQREAKILPTVNQLLLGKSLMAKVKKDPQRKQFLKKHPFYHLKILAFLSWITYLNVAMIEIDK